MGLIPWSLAVDVLRLLSIVSFLFCSLTFTWYSFVSLIGVLVSLYVLDRNKYQTKPNQQSNTSSVKNPYKGTRRVKDESNIPPDVREKYTDRILDLVLYEVEETRALREFEPIKMNTHCIFARKSILWGSRDYHKSLSVEENVIR
ncbi:hypothetical protein GBAR_LOCUS7097 [Geodia barretti]|nr:hypothetical protein GBAR_LOCUS7097 [Geodia barretti]